jgi:DNA segregation ATPase FtsK/SpoIIIE, S-DNA-T family
MTWYRLSVPDGSRYKPVLLEADPDATWVGITAALTPAAGIPLDNTVDGEAVPAGATLGTRPLRDGSHIGGQVPSTKLRPGTSALAVVNGPAAGQLISVHSGEHHLGRSDPIALDDTDVSRQHATLIVDTNGNAAIADGTTKSPSSNGTTLNGATVPQRARRTPPSPLAPSDVIRIGNTGLGVLTVPPADAALTDDGAGGLSFNRPPRTPAAPQPPPLQWPAAPTQATRVPLDVLGMSVPLLAGIGMAIFMRRPEFLLFTALTPIMLATRALMDRRSGKRKRGKDGTQYATKLREAQAELTARLETEASIRRQVHPDPATARLTAVGHSSRLWERRPQDPDALSLRLGLGTGMPNTTVTGLDTPLPQLPEVPITVNLAEIGSLGLTGDRKTTRSAARWLICQLAVAHSPEDVRVWLLAADGPEQTQADWDFLRWLPHTRSESGAVDSLLGTTNEAVKKQVTALNQIREQRAQQRRPGAARAATSDAVHVVVLDGSYELRLEHDLDALLGSGTEAGILFICIDDTTTQLPGQCRVSAQLRGPSLTLTDGHRKDVLSADLVSANYADHIARALAPIRDVSRHRIAGALPPTVLLEDLAHTRLTDPDQILAGWTRQGRSTQAILGAGTEGPYALDLALGPHVLIGGTTGSGKSQLLITFVTSLALANRPDALNFILIDYKGAAAFRPFAALPHVIGLVTDLTPSLTQRALTSLKAEVDRRKRLLDEAGTSSIEQYWLMRDRGEPLATEKLPRLVIVVDEFALLASELPGFIEQLVVVATQGRSFGIHLVLATQRPSKSVISDEIRANVNVRIALRTSSIEESDLILSAPDAGRLPTTGYNGRAYVRIGSEPLIPIQTALATTAASRTGQPTAHEWAWANVASTPPRLHDTAARDTAAQQELQMIIAAIGAAAMQGQYSAAPPIWLEALPDHLPAAELERVPGHLPYGRIDVPTRQTQLLASVHLAAGEPLIAGGGPGSGRTTLLRTLAAAAVTTHSADELHLYVIDGGGHLTALEALPNTAAFISPDETDRATRLLARLTDELTTRTRLLTDSQAATIAEYNTTAKSPLPSILLLIDSYEALSAALTNFDGGRPLEQLTRIIRQGRSVGMSIIVAGDKTLLGSRLATNVTQRLVLPLSTVVDYQTVNVPLKAVPNPAPPGRAVHLPTLGETQIASIAATVNQRQDDVIRELSLSLPPRKGTSTMLRVDRLPDGCNITDALKLATHADVTWPVAVGGDDLGRVGFDPSTEGPGFLITGSARSGRTNVLAVAANSAATTGWPLVLIVPYKSEALVAAVPDGTPILTITSDPDDLLQAAAAAGRPTMIVVDDADAIIDSPLGLAVASLLRTARTSGHRVIAATTIGENPLLRGFLIDLKVSRCGLLLSPRPAHGTVFDLGRLPDWAISATTGRAVLVRRGLITSVAIPLV